MQIKFNSLSYGNQTQEHNDSVEYWVVNTLRNRPIDNHYELLALLTARFLTTNPETIEDVATAIGCKGWDHTLYHEESISSVTPEPVVPRPSVTRLTPLPSKEEVEKAFFEIGKHEPCPHHAVDTTIGNGKTWARCEDCDRTIEQDSIVSAQAENTRFNKALDVLSDAIGR